MVRVFLVFPDLSQSKMEAIHRIGPIDLLLSITTLTWKPVSLERLLILKREGAVEGLMLDSGAYHHARGDASIDPVEYARASTRLAGVFDYIVAPDLPGDMKATLERTLVFSRIFPGHFIPVAQPGPGGYQGSIDMLARSGLIERALRVEGGRRLIGIGGLDGPRRRVRYVASLIDGIEAEYPGLALHLFGVGARILRGLARRGLLDPVYSVDSSGWLHEIMWRRRSVYNASTPVDANASAIAGYLARVRSAIGA